MQAKNYDLPPSFSENIFGSRLPYKKIKRILTGKKHRQMKLLHLQKVQIFTFGLLV